MTAPDTTVPRTPLSTQRVLEAAIELVDREGLGALTMRRLGSALGVEAMSLYKHVASKEAMLDGMVDRIIGTIEVPVEGAPWRAAMTLRANSAREVLGRHAWVIGLLEAGTPSGPSALRYLNAIIGSLLAAGFSMADAGRAFMVLDSYVYGHVVQESSFPFATPEEITETVESALAQEALSAFPNLVAMYEHALTFEHSLDAQFEFGLELVLDGLERLRAG